MSGGHNYVLGVRVRRVHVRGCYVSYKNVTIPVISDFPLWYLGYSYTTYTILLPLMYSPVGMAYTVLGLLECVQEIGATGCSEAAKITNSNK